MNAKQKELIEHLIDLAEGYYAEQVKDEEGVIIYKIPDDHPEKDFIQEVFLVCHELLEVEKRT